MGNVNVKGRFCEFADFVAAITKIIVVFILFEAVADKGQVVVLVH